MKERFPFRNNNELLQMPGILFRTANILQNSLNMENDLAEEKRLKYLLKRHPKILLYYRKIFQQLVSNHLLKKTWTGFRSSVTEST
jgi:hypothetical protein